jgi:hypothetical protein
MKKINTTSSVSTVRVPKYRSNLERDFNSRFKLPFETQRLSYTVEHTYTPDFALGPNLFVETKGIFTSADRSKHLYIRKQHPDVRVLFIFQVPSMKLTKNSKTSYADWCDKHGFAWLSIKDINSHSVETLSVLLSEQKRETK